jgi:ATP-binding cassette, subfamily A (ABC1), member 3
MFLLYFLAYMSVLTFAPVDKINSYINITHFAIATVTPMGNLARSMYVAFNIFSLDCRGQDLATYPGEITLYGGPILYLIVQFFVLFGLLLWVEGGPRLSVFRARFKSDDVERKRSEDEAVSNELERISRTNDGLRVLHVTKTFGKFVAVEDVTFGVRRGEVFALLGPNGAGKTTTISLIRGDLRPSNRSGNVFVENISVMNHRSTARLHLGFCPQFDAMDQMTVLEHLCFYASVRGVPDVDHNVRTIVHAIGLTPYMNRMAAKLSGGNKRKLSLGIALIGNPTVLLLDEPSSGLDAASKRIMWRTLASVIPGRSLVLTTHSMEEADALANRAGIMAKRMLALGSTEELRRKYGNMYHVHLVHADAPHTSGDSMKHLRDWVQGAFPGAAIEQRMYHGQLRFSIAASSPPSPSADESTKSEGEDIQQDITPLVPSTNTKRNSISNVFLLLERNKKDLGIQYYSVSQTSLDQVFLTIVGKHNVGEGDSGN